MMERAKQVLREARVDRDLAADARVELPDERRREVRVAEATHERRRREPTEIRDHAAAECEQQVAPHSLLPARRSSTRASRPQRLRTFALGEHDPVVAHARCFEAAAARRRRAGAPVGR